MLFFIILFETPPKFFLFLLTLYKQYRNDIGTIQERYRKNTTSPKV
ncbi:hypothetical protein HMPREF9074_08961 [Capnocytophaga sp. oral taxon 329 str. F0087]|nr:hypothetical protein HMPREF9074_08961 [Capnocytophaga sp. oral taxon 329 str. F0087]